MAEQASLLEQRDVISQGDAPRPWSRISVLSTSGLLLLCGAVTLGHHLGDLGSGAVAADGQRRVEASQVVLYTPSDLNCSGPQEDCWMTGCCSHEDHKCFMTKPGLVKDRLIVDKAEAKCMPECVLGRGNELCIEMNWPNQMGAENWRRQKNRSKVGDSLYCFAVVFLGGGGVSGEQELLQQAFDRKIGIFACDQTGLFTNREEVSLRGGPPFTVVEDVDGDFFFAKRELTGAWINTGIYSQAWKAVADEIHHSSAAWVVKADADAVFVASRLRRLIKDVPVGEDGVYVASCPGAAHTFFGNLEVFSRQAFATLRKHIDVCKVDKSIAWKECCLDMQPIPMGEDMFAQKCMDFHGVGRLDGIDVTFDALCSARRLQGGAEGADWVPDCSTVAMPAIHPFKQPDAWLACYEATVAAHGE